MQHRLVVFSLAVAAAGAGCGHTRAAPADAGPRDAAAADAPELTDAAPPPDGGPVACPDYRALKNAYFGDLHAHTSYSLDAYSFATRNTPLDAYAFARGQTLPVGSGVADGGTTTTIERPLDFLAVTDHSEWLAATYGCVYDPAAPVQPGTCDPLRSSDPATVSGAWNDRQQLMDALCDGGPCPTYAHNAWQSEQQAAAAAYVPCQFTSFVAYEWTFSVGGTLHKNVIFATDRVPAVPLDSFAYPSQEALWTGLDDGCRGDAGCEAITIPHNSNLSNGLAFVLPAGLEAQAARYQRLVEVFQHKGGSECYYDPDPDAGPQEAVCDFEYAGGRAGNSNLPASYIRHGLVEGLARADAGVNPFMMGFIGATDDHNGTPGNTREDTWPGHEGRFDDTPALRLDPNKIQERQYKNPGGLAVAWAEQNTRDSIFAAFRRRETYATSGTRPVVRFYETWSSDDPCADADFPAAVVAGGGVPMGGTFGPPPAGASGGPRFVVYAWKDKTDLARIDVIKLWLDSSGNPHQSQVHDVIPAGAGNARCFAWQDSAFTPGPTLYYARVLEAPTPRWSVSDCERAQDAAPAECAPGGALNYDIQERAWTSPIWYAQ